jgi:hypothetical protein
MKLLQSRLLGVALIVALLGFWELVTDTKLVHSPSLPPVSAILIDWWRLTFNGTLIAQLGPSLGRVAAGYGAAVVVGVAIGLAMGYYRVAYNLLEPLTELLRPIPSPAYIPLAIIFLGFGRRDENLRRLLRVHLSDLAEHVRRRSGNRSRTAQHGPYVPPLPRADGAQDRAACRAAVDPHRDAH